MTTSHSMISRLMRADLPRVNLETPMTEVAEILKARATRSATSNPMLVVCSSSGAFEGLINLLDVLRWMSADDPDGTAESATVESRMRRNVVKLHPHDTLDTVLSAVAKSAAGGCPVLDGSQFLGVVLVEDVFSHIAERVLLEDLDRTDA